MTFGQFLAIFRARWMLALGIIFTTVLAALVVSLLTPKKYTASAAIVIDLRSQDQFTANTVGAVGAPSYIATQVDILRSRAVAMDVAKTLKLADNPEIRARWLKATKGTGDIEAWAANSLSLSLVAKPSRESNVVSVAYTAATPDAAARIANMFVDAYMKSVLGLRTAPAQEYSELFDEQSKNMRLELETARMRLAQFQKDNGLIDVNNVDSEAARLDELSTQLAGLTSAAIESGSRQSAAAGRGEQLQEVLNNSLITGLKADLARTEAKLRELSDRLGENHPQIIETQSNIRSLQARIATETGRVSGSVSMTNNVNQSRVAQLRSAIEAQRRKVLDLKTARAQADTLAHDVESKQRAYDAVLNRVTQTSLESKNTRSNVTVLERAVEPSAPSSPNTKMNLMLAFAGGLVLAIAALLGREFSDRRLRTVTEISQVIDQPILGVLPSFKKLQASSHRTLSSPRLTMSTEKAKPQLTASAS